MGASHSGSSRVGYSSICGAKRNLAPARSVNEVEMARSRLARVPSIRPSPAIAGALGALWLALSPGVAHASLAVAQRQSGVWQGAPGVAHGALSPPSGLRLAGSGATSLTVEWAARRGARAYRLRYREAGDRRWRRRRVGRHTRAVLAGLAAGRVVSIEVRSCAGRRCSRWSRALRAAPRRRRSPAEPVPTFGAGGPVIGGCPVFPANNPWNRDVSRDPVDPSSDAYIGSLGGNLHPDFGSDPSYGIPYVVVPASQPSVPIDFTAYGDESDPGPYPIPPSAPVEGGSDRHVLVLQRDTCQLFELYHASFSGASDQHWNADSGARFDLRSNALRRDGWTSADAAGLPILPGLVRFDEVRGGAIHHAIRVTFDRTQKGYIHPATHFASDSTDPSLPPMGLRLRLKASFDVSGFPPDARVILQAMKTYGLIVADNGSNWYFTGATDSRWDDGQLNALKGVPGSAFEAVQSGPILRAGG
jgi:hypothetical protein